MVSSTFKDDDYIKDGISMMVNWTNKFLNDKTTIKLYHLYISTTPGGKTFDHSLSNNFEINHILSFNNKNDNKSFNI